MDIRDTSEVIELLDRVAEADETWRVETFRMHRRNKAGDHQDVTVEILDRGPTFSPRYSVSADSSDGKKCSGNSGDDLTQTISLVHWYQLDR
ncbi:hypothetical protein BKD30_04090 [Tersicoccus phoenicis]|uniref:Uncharacterized protein n=1 Tax=Tersicoccus phoenicis TaxID=554083 RepID=A0A1R1LHQ8_9MICC|nr:hypothetical protein [Tersicoccus phoenicis]OMH27074.1 hypothetical protein BKD30_04090 [Tersicoccus phoenicis]